MDGDLGDSSLLRRPALRVKHNRSCPATTCSLIRIFLYFSLTVLTVVYFAYFVNTDVMLKNQYGQKHCSLFAKPSNEPGENGPCSFFTAGSGVLIGLFLVLVIIGVFSAICGKWSVCLKGLELFILILCVFVSVSASAVLSTGYYKSCDHTRQKCRSIKFDRGDVHVGNRLYYVECGTWLITGVLVLLLVVEFLFCLCMCFCRSRSSNEEQWFDKRALLSNKKAAEAYS